VIFFPCFSLLYQRFRELFSSAGQNASGRTHFADMATKQVYRHLNFPARSQNTDVRDFVIWHLTVIDVVIP
jgi:hypothetical protein